MKKVSGGVASSRTRGIVLEVDTGHPLDVRDDRLLQVPEPVVSSRPLLGAFYRCIDVRLVWVGQGALGGWAGTQNLVPWATQRMNFSLCLKAAVAKIYYSAMSLVSKIRRQKDNTIGRSNDNICVQQGRD